jgi:putative glutamine amidotransferase
MKPRIGITTSPRPKDDCTVDGANRSYASAVLAAGGIPLLLPVLAPDAAAEVLASVDGLLLSGGADVDPARYGAVAIPAVYGVNPERDAWELALLAAAEATAVPTLGICRGAQILNVARGGTLVLDLPDHRVPDRYGEVIHQVVLEPGSLLTQAARCRAIGVNTLHHQAVDVVGRGLRAVGWATDGTIEAVEAVDGAPVLAVQWHPELLPTLPGHPELFRWLVDRAAGRALAVASPSSPLREGHPAWRTTSSAPTPA